MDIETRLARVERSVRRWQVAAGVLLCAAIAGWAFGAQRAAAPKVAEEIRAKRLVIEKDNGQEVIQIGADEKGQGILIFGKPGKPSILLNADPEGDGSVSVFDGKRKHQASISARPQGGNIHLGPTSDKTIFFAGSDDDGKSFLTLQGTDGKVILEKSEAGSR